MKKIDNNAKIKTAHRSPSFVEAFNEKEIPRPIHVLCKHVLCKKIFSLDGRARGRDGVVFLQEVHCTPEVKDIWSMQWKGQTYFSFVTNQSRGVMILIGHNV